MTFAARLLPGLKRSATVLRDIGSAGRLGYDDSATAAVLDPMMLAEAMAYEDDDVRITPAGVEKGRSLSSVKPIDFLPSLCQVLVAMRGDACGPSGTTHCRRTCCGRQS